jgi:hypothetical protein
MHFPSTSPIEEAHFPMLSEAEEAEMDKARSGFRDGHDDGHSDHGAGYGAGDRDGDSHDGDDGDEGDEGLVIRSGRGGGGESGSVGGSSGYDSHTRLLVVMVVVKMEDECIVMNSPDRLVEEGEKVMGSRMGDNKLLKGLLGIRSTSLRWRTTLRIIPWIMADRPGYLDLGEVLMVKELGGGAGMEVEAMAKAMMEEGSAQVMKTWIRFNRKYQRVTLRPWIGP